MENEVKEFELLAKVEQKAVVSYDKAGIENYVKAVEEKYKGIVFTDENIDLAKTERASLNKLKSSVDTYRKNITGELTSEIKVFDTDFKNYASRIDAVSSSIDIQVKKFEEIQIELRVKKVSDYLNKILEEFPKYEEFRNQLQPTNSNKLYTLKGSFGKDGEVGQKIIDFIQVQLSQFDEVLNARELAEKLLQEKRELIVSQCASTSEMLDLKIPLSPKQFAYLKDYELSEITNEINRAAKEQRKKEEEAVKKIEEEARIKAEKEALEKIKEEEKQKVVESFDGTQEEFTSNADNFLKKVEETKEVQEVKASTKLFYGVIEFEGIEVSKATAFRKFLDENGIQFKTIKSEVK